MHHVDTYCPFQTKFHVALNGFAQVGTNSEMVNTWWFITSQVSIFRIKVKAVGLKKCSVHVAHDICFDTQRQFNGNVYTQWEFDFILTNVILHKFSNGMYI